MSGRVFILVLMVMLARPGSSQDVLYNLEHLTTEHGLSNNIVFSILQDSRGYLWVGTDDGLNRYNGYSFENFLSGQSGTHLLSGSRVSDLLEDSRGVIWIATPKAIWNYNYTSGQITPFATNIESGAEKFIRMSKTEILVKAPGAVYHIDIHAGSTVRIGFSVPDSVEYNYDSTARIVQDHQGNALLAQVHGKQIRLWRFDANLKVFKESCHVLFGHGKDDQTFNVFFIDRSGRHWFSTLYGIYSFVPDPGIVKTMHPELVLKNDTNTSNLKIFDDRNGHVWICTTTGLIHYQKENGTTRRYFNTRADDFSQSDVVNTIYQDRSGILWIGTFKGLIKYNSLTSRFKHLTTQNRENPKLVARAVLGIYPQNKKLLRIHYLFGTPHYSLFNPEEKAISHHPITKTNIYEWMLKTGLTNPEQLESTTRKKLSPILDTMAIFNNGLPGSMTVDAQQNVWFSYGPYVVNINHQTRRLLDENIYSITPNNDLLWIATDKGLTYLHIPTETLSHSYYSVPMVDNSMVTAPATCFLFEDNDNIWIGSKGGGLIYVNQQRNELNQFTEKDGLSHNSIYSMVKDETGRLWLGTAMGLSCFDPGSRQFRNYYRSDGLINSEFNRYSAIRLENGTILMGGMDGIDYFDPQYFNEPVVKPLVQITDFRVFNRSMNPGNVIHLPHDENFVTFEFALMDFSDPERNTFFYQLEGIDRDWVSSEKRHFASYPNLLPGRYTFLVKGRNSNGIWSEHPAKAEFAIQTPWWSAWWFYLACILTGTSLLYGFYRYRMNNLKKIYAIRNEISQDLHDQVGATLTSISFLSEVAKLNADEDTPPTDTLNKIGEYSREMIGEMNDIVWSINPANDRFDKMTNRMRDYASPLLAAKDIQFHFEEDTALKQVILTAQQRKNLYLIFKEAVNNAAKYAACYHLTVRLRRQQQHILLTITDDGKGFSKEEKENGNGLKNMKMRAASIRAAFHLETHPGNGTRIQISMPITQNTYRGYS